MPPYRFSSPYHAYYVTHGRLAGGLFLTLDAPEEPPLAAEAVALRLRAPRLPFYGDQPTPAGEGPAMKGRRRVASSLLVLFWNPGCNLCLGILEDLKALEADPPKGAPRLLVVSHGTVEVKRAMGFRSQVVLVQSLDARRAFGASDTPSAVLVDRKGNVASELVVGAPAVLELAGGRNSGL